MSESPWSPGKMISWECKVKDEVKNENKVDVKIKVETKDELGDLCFMFSVCDMTFYIWLKFDFVAQAATGFYFFYRKKSKQKSSQPKKLTLTFVIVSKISLLYLVVFSWFYAYAQGHRSPGL